MALSIGRCRAKILKNSVRDINEKVAVSLILKTEQGDETEALIFVTDKSYGIARRQLKIAGFDVDAQDLTELEDKPELLAGKIVPLVVETYNGKMRPQIDMQAAPEKSAIARAQEGLRAVKKRGEFPDEPPLDDGDVPF